MRIAPEVFTLDDDEYATVAADPVPVEQETLAQHAADESVLIGGVGAKHGQIENTSVTGLPTIAEIATLQLDDAKGRLAR